MLCPEHGGTNNIDHHNRKSNNNHNHKILIILFPDTIINPHTVMIEILHTSAAGTAMSRCQTNITVTYLTI